MTGEVVRYIEVMKEIRDSIKQLQGEKYINNHKKTLLFSLLDTMSKGVYGDKYHRNHIRFVNFIKEFCEWEVSERVSLQQLALLLERTQDREYVLLKRYVIENLSTYPMSTAVYFDYDPTIEQLLEQMPNGEHRINNVSIESLTHVYLLWKYRNSLVHEARGLGAEELFEENDPHYIHYIQLGRDNEGNIIKKKYWQKLYPLNFFIELINKAISNTESYLVQNEINPYDNYNFEPLWIEVRS